MSQLRNAGFILLLATAFLMISVTSLTLLGEVMPAMAQGGVLYVASTGTDNPICGSSQATPCRTIKYAVETRAQINDQIQVAAGTYTDTFTLNTTGVQVLGPGADAAIIDGEGVRGPLVTFGANIDNTSVFSGFTVQNGNGGGLYVQDSNPVLQALVVQSNTASTGVSGGIQVVGGAAPMLHGSTVCGNSGVQLVNAGSGTVDATGNWWGSNTPTVGDAYTGTVNVSPPLSVSLEIQQTGSAIFPGGTTLLPYGQSAVVTVTMQGGGAMPPAGTELTIFAFRGLFANGLDFTALPLIEGRAGAVFTPTSAQPVIISPVHPCPPLQAITSTGVSIIDNRASVYLPLTLKASSGTPPPPVCPTTSGNTYKLIQFLGNPIDHPDRLHGDLNLAQRSYSLVDGAPLTLIDYPGATDPDSPLLFGLFSDQRVPTFIAGYNVNSWVWNCGTDGCQGPPLAMDWPITLLGMQTTPGESIYIPQRSADIFADGGLKYKALVLYAEEKRITFAFTRDDSVASGYAVHIEGLCVDSSLLSLYRQQVDEAGFRATGMLPGLRDGQPIGTAWNEEIKVAIRDRGNFMDPRSRKDWWKGKSGRGLSLSILHSAGN